MRLALDYYGLSPMYGGEAPVQNTDMVFAKGHTEQHVKATGTIAVNGQQIALNALGLRDHSWGPRSWQSPRFYRWLTCEFTEHFGFMGSQIVMQNGTEILSGFVFKDGENLWVNTLELHTGREGDGITIASRRGYARPPATSTSAARCSRCCRCATAATARSRASPRD